MKIKISQLRRLIRETINEVSADQEMMSMEDAHRELSNYEVKFEVSLGNEKFMVGVNQTMESETLGGVEINYEEDAREYKIFRSADGVNWQQVYPVDPMSNKFLIDLGYQLEAFGLGPAAEQAIRNESRRIMDA